MSTEYLFLLTFKNIHNSIGNNKYKILRGKKIP